MPLHEYECTACGHRFEAIQKFSDPPLERCPKCGGVLRKLIASPAFQFKGSGWYITDYARKNAAEAPKTGSAEGSPEGKADAKSEKTEKATPSKSDASPSVPTTPAKD